jgi:hypothetical protein
MSYTANALGPYHNIKEHSCMDSRCIERVYILLEIQNNSARLKKYNTNLNIFKHISCVCTTILKIRNFRVFLRINM